jgi:DhnA family fructose-bisphosphate aldolase class Ia
MVEGAIRAGATGVVFGRNVFQAPNSEKMTKAICQVVFEEATAAEAVNALM